MLPKPSILRVSYRVEILNLSFSSYSNIQQEREQYEYVVVEGKIVHQQTGKFLDTNGVPGAKWIFVMSTSKRLYAGEVRTVNLL